MPKKLPKVSSYCNSIVGDCIGDSYCSVSDSRGNFTIMCSHQDRWCSKCRLEICGHCYEKTECPKCLGNTSVANWTRSHR